MLNPPEHVVAIEGGGDGFFAEVVAGLGATADATLGVDGVGLGNTLVSGDAGVEVVVVSAPAGGAGVSGLGSNG